MKTSIDIPDNVLEEAMRYSGASTKREAILTAMRDFIRRRKMADLVRHEDTCEDLMTVEELEAMRKS